MYYKINTVSKYGVAPLVFTGINVFDQIKCFSTKFKSVVWIRIGCNADPDPGYLRSDLWIQIRIQGVKVAWK